MYRQFWCIIWADPEKLRDPRDLSGTQMNADSLFICVYPRESASKEFGCGWKPHYAIHKERIK
jgi:hypothetical protein